MANRAILATLIARASGITLSSTTDAAAAFDPLGAESHTTHVISDEVRARCLGTPAADIYDDLECFQAQLLDGRDARPASFSAGQEICSQYWDDCEREVSTCPEPGMTSLESNPLAFLATKTVVRQVPLNFNSLSAARVHKNTNTSLTPSTNEGYHFNYTRARNAPRYQGCGTAGMLTVDDMRECSAGDSHNKIGLFTNFYTDHIDDYGGRAANLRHHGNINDLSIDEDDFTPICGALIMAPFDMLTEDPQHDVRQAEIARQAEAEKGRQDEAIQQRAADAEAAKEFEANRLQAEAARKAAEQAAAQQQITTEASDATRVAITGPGTNLKQKNVQVKAVTQFGLLQAVLNRINRKFRYSSKSESARQAPGIAPFKLAAPSVEQMRSFEDQCESSWMICSAMDPAGEGNTVTKDTLLNHCPDPVRLQKRGCMEAGMIMADEIDKEMYIMGCTQMLGEQQSVNQKLLNPSDYYEPPVADNMTFNGTYITHYPADSVHPPLYHEPHDMPHEDPHAADPMHIPGAGEFAPPPAVPVVDPAAAAVGPAAAAAAAPTTPGAFAPPPADAAAAPAAAPGTAVDPATAAAAAPAAAPGTAVDPATAAAAPGTVVDPATAAAVPPTAAAAGTAAVPPAAGAAPAAAPGTAAVPPTAAAPGTAAAAAPGTAAVPPTAAAPGTAAVPPTTAAPGTAAVPPTAAAPGTAAAAAPGTAAAPAPATTPTVTVTAVPIPAMPAPQSPTAAAPIMPAPTTATETVTSSGRFDIEPVPGPPPPPPMIATTFVQTGVKFVIGGAKTSKDIVTDVPSTATPAGTDDPASSIPKLTDHSPENYQHSTGTVYYPGYEGAGAAPAGTYSPTTTSAPVPAGTAAPAVGSVPGQFAPPAAVTPTATTSASPYTGDYSEYAPTDLPYTIPPPAPQCRLFTPSNMCAKLYDFCSSEIRRTDWASLSLSDLQSQPTLTHRCNVVKHILEKDASTALATSVTRHQFLEACALYSTGTSYEALSRPTDPALAAMEKDMALDPAAELAFRTELEASTMKCDECQGSCHQATESCHDYAERSEACTRCETCTSSPLSGCSGFFSKDFQCEMHCPTCGQCQSSHTHCAIAHNVQQCLTLCCKGDDCSKSRHGRHHEEHTGIFSHANDAAHGGDSEMCSLFPLETLAGKPAIDSTDMCAECHTRCAGESSCVNTCTNACAVSDWERSYRASGGHTMDMRAVERSAMTAVATEILR